MLDLSSGRYFRAFSIVYLISRLILGDILFSTNLESFFSY